MKSDQTTGKGLWEITNVQCLLRHKLSRKYYGRFTLRRKQKWVNLETTVMSVAKLRLADEAKKIEKLRSLIPSVSAGRATIGDLMATYQERTRANSDLKPSSIVSRETALKKVKKTWPNIENLTPQGITPAAVQDWAARFKINGTNFVPNGAKKALKGNSSTSVNRAIDTLRRILDIAVEKGQIHTNPVSVKPAEGRLKKKVTQKKLVLPTRDEAMRMIVAMRDAGAHGGWGIEAAFLCSYLLMTGSRIGEVPLTLWKHVDWEKTELFLPGFKTESSPRYIPLFPELGLLLKDLMDWRKAVAARRPDGRAFLESTDGIFRIKECQKTIDAACEKTGVHRITHHDWRHLFATRCIESGVDIPTVSRWLGHSDGGVLAMKTYSHLCRDHSQQAALKVNFHSATAAVS